MFNVDEGLLFEGKLPVSLKAIDQLPESEQLIWANEKNEGLLRVALMPAEHLETDEHDEISIELKRQELKINMLMDMIGELLLHHNELPPSAAVKLTPLGLECEEELASSQDDGELVEVKLYITPSIPRPLSLYGEICPSDTKGKACVRFVGINRAVQDSLEKLIFRHHRRAIAQGLASK